MAGMKRNLAPGFQRFEFRSGFDGFTWRGMRTEGDPSSNPPNQPRLLVNCRFTGNGLTNRPGLTEFNSSVYQSASACITGLFPFPTYPKKLWIQGDGCPGVSSSLGFYLANLDPEQDPELQRSVYYGSASNQPILALFGTDLYIGVDSTLRKLEPLSLPWGTENITISGTSQDTPIATFTTAAGYDANYTVRCMKEFDGQLYIGLDNGAGASKVVTYDGLSIRDDLTGINVPTCFGLYRVTNGGDAIVVGFAAASGQLRRRPTGASPGTWTTISGTVASVQMSDYGDILYIAGGNANIYQLSGDTISVARAPASATAVRSVWADDGYLYFCYDTAANGIVGKYDGSTWTDVEKNLTLQFGAGVSARGIAFYRGYWYVAGVRSSGKVWYAASGSTSGSWTEIDINSSNSGDADVLLVA